MWSKFRDLIKFTPSSRPLWRRKNSDWASDRLTSRVSLWKWQGGGPSVRTPCQVARPHRAFFSVRALCWPRLPQCVHSLLLRKKASLRIVLVWRAHLANLVPLSLLIALSLEGLSGRAPSIDFPPTMKLWNGIPEWLWVSYLMTSAARPFACKETKRFLGSCASAGHWLCTLDCFWWHQWAEKHSWKIWDVLLTPTVLVVA